MLQFIDFVGYVKWMIVTVNSSRSPPCEQKSHIIVSYLMKIEL